MPTPHPKRFSPRASATASAGCVACERARSIQVNDLHDGPCGFGCGTAERWMAQVRPGGSVAATSRHRRDAVTQTRSRQVGGYTAHCLDSAAVSTARHDVQVLGSCRPQPALASARQFGRCALVGGTNPEKRLLRGRRALAVERPLRILEAVEPGSPKHRYMAMADTAAFQQCRLVAITASNRASAGSRRCIGRHYQTSGASL